MSKTIKSLVNGQPASSLNLSDRGLQYGDGVFRTMLVCDGHVVELESQLAKLRADTEAIGIKAVDDKVWLEDINVLLDVAAQTSVLKLVITRGQGGRGYRAEAGLLPTRIALCYPLDTAPDHFWSAGVALYLCDTRLGHSPSLAGIKHLNRLEQVLARNEFALEYQEGLMLDIQDAVISGTMSNLFVVQNGVVRTPSLERCGVMGVMRGKILQLARKAGVDINIETLNLDDIFKAEEVFLSNSLIGIWPVKSLESHAWRPGPVTRQLQKLLRHPRPEV